MNTVFREPTVLLEEQGTQVVREASVYIRDDVIESIGTEPEGFHADKTINGAGKLLIPGLVNAHTHAYMTLFRNRADDLPFDDWLFGNILPLEDRLKAGDSYWGALLAVMEMLRTGTTCFSDMHMFVNETAQAVEESGIKACISRGLVDDTPEGGERRLQEAKKEMETWGKGKSLRLRFMLAPHAPYTCSPGYLQRVAEEAAVLGVGIHIHLAESRNETSGIRDRYQCTPTEYLQKAGILTERTAAAHCVYLTESDMDILAEKKANVITNPVSNLKLGNGFAPLRELMPRKINICLGTDGAASNNSQNLFRDLQFAVLIHKGACENAELVSAREALQFATVNGARALGFSDTGKIEPGRKADLVLLDIDRPQFYPRNNLLSALAYSATGTEVETVMVDGKILMENNEMLTIDEEKIKYNVMRIAKNLEG